MAQAKQGDTVQVHYTGKLTDGTVFDSSDGREPLQFTLGEGRVIPGFEEAVDGLAVGDSVTAEIPSDKAYGPRSDDMIFQVDRDQFPADIEPQIGMPLQVQLSNGQVTPVTVHEVTDHHITLDANHRLAGEDLMFDIQLVGIV